MSHTLGNRKSELEVTEIKGWEGYLVEGETGLILSMSSLICRSGMQVKVASSHLQIGPRILKGILYLFYFHIGFSQKPDGSLC